MAGSTLVQLRVPDDLLARIDEACEGSTRTAWLLGLAAEELDDAGPDREPVQASGVRSIGPGLPAPGVLCIWAACMSRDCDRYGVTDPAELTRRDYASRARHEDKAGLALCKAHAATLEGRVHKAARRELPPSWSKGSPTRRPPRSPPGSAPGPGCARPGPPAWRLLPGPPTR